MVNASPDKRKHWYPTNTTLGDGSVLVTPGETEPDILLPNDQQFPERWHNGAWTPPLNGAPKTLPLYPWMFQAPNGKVFYARPGPGFSYLNPTDVDPAGKVSTSTSVDGQARTYNNRGQGSAVMCAPGKILLVGGSDGISVPNTTEIIDLPPPELPPSAPPRFRTALKSGQGQAE